MLNSHKYDCEIYTFQYVANIECSPLSLNWYCNATKRRIDNNKYPMCKFLVLPVRFFWHQRVIETPYSGPITKKHKHSFTWSYNGETSTLLYLDLKRVYNTTPLRGPITEVHQNSFTWPKTEKHQHSFTWSYNGETSNTHLRGPITGIQHYSFTLPYNGGTSTLLYLDLERRNINTSLLDPIKEKLQDSFKTPYNGYTTLLLYVTL